MARKWEMNLEETSSVTLETLGTTVLQTARPGAANSPAPSSVQSMSLCQRASPVFVVSSPIVTEEQQRFATVEVCRDSRFTLEVCWVPQSWIS